jgi:1,4-dihydroxy-2-naphthoyl-CoA hydrolase
MIWFKEQSLDEINSHCKNTMVDFLDIKVSKITENQLEAIMPVSDKVRQPYGIVHGGANCVLAETLGSLAANFTLDYEKSHAVGLSINTSHIKAVRNGNVRGVASAEHIGRTTQVWKIDTFNDSDQLSSTTTLTMAVIKKNL